MRTTCLYVRVVRGSERARAWCLTKVCGLFDNSDYIMSQSHYVAEISGGTKINARLLLMIWKHYTCQAERANAQASSNERTMPSHVPLPVRSFIARWVLRF